MYINSNYNFIIYTNTNTFECLMLMHERESNKSTFIFYTKMGEL